MSKNHKAFEKPQITSNHFSQIRKETSLWRKIIRTGGLILLIFTIVLAGLLGSWLKSIGIFDLNEKNLSAIVDYKHYDNSVVFDRDDQKIGEFFSYYHIFVPYSEIPKEMIQALISVEDRNFFSHPGFDLKGILRAIISRVKGSKLKQGASTLTQQLVRNFILTKDRTMERKVKEIILSLYLEQNVSKEKILEMYLNALYLGNGAYGIGAASQRYFGKPISKLELNEIALIAGLYQSPSRYNPSRFPKRAKKRQKQVLIAMVNTGRLSKVKARYWYKKPLKYKNYLNKNLSTAPYFIDYIQERTQELISKGVKNTGLRIYTTLDMKAQRAAQIAIKNAAENIKEADRYKISASIKNDTEAALLSTNPHTGEILSMVGGRNYKKSQFNRTVHAKRAPGSAFKPIVYSYAIKKGMKWSDLLYISPISVDGYRPKNSSGSFLSETTMARAMYKSINTVAIEIGQKLGVSNILEHAHKLGIDSELRAEAGSLLGSSEVYMMEMATAYSALDNNGVKVKPFAIRYITNNEGDVLWEDPGVKSRSEEVMSDKEAYLMIEGMRNVFKYGTAYKYKGMASYSVGKTGTSNNAKDNWFCGFTPNLLTTVWVGADKGKGFHKFASGASLALLIWADYTKSVLRDQSIGSFPSPQGFVELKIDPKFGTIDRNGIPMFFLEGSEPVSSTSTLKKVTHAGSYRNYFDQ